MTLVIFDLETTGWSPYSNEIIQIAAVKMRDGCLEEGATFVRPEARVPWHITNLTGITRDHVRDAPSVTEALQSFARFVDVDATLIAHNAVFDMSFIRKICTRHGLPVREVGVIDSLALFQRFGAVGSGTIWML